MGVDTKVKLVGFVKPDEVIKVLEKNLGLSVKDGTSIERQVFYDEDIVYLGQEGIIETLLGFIRFEYKGNHRALWYHHANVVFIDNKTTKHYVEEGLPELIGEVTNLSLGYNEDAVEILTEVAKELGGYIDEHDCDDEYYHKLSKD